MFNINYSRVTRYVLLLIIGMSLICYGILTLSRPQSVEVLSDAEIIQRAKALGLVEPRDQYIEQTNE